MRCPVLIISPWFWSKSFTLSIGAAADLATMAAAPPIMKSVENFSGFPTKAIFLACPHLIQYEIQRIKRDEE